jgi:hypothetical protein
VDAQAFHAALHANKEAMQDIGTKLRIRGYYDPLKAAIEAHNEAEARGDAPETEDVPVEEAEQSEQDEDIDETPFAEGLVPSEDDNDG